MNHREGKMVVVSKPTWKRLMTRRIELDMKTMDEVISDLLDNEGKK